MNGKINQLPKFVKRGNWGPKKGQSWAEVVLDQLDDRLQEKWWEMSTCSPSLIRHCKAVWDTGIVWKALAVSVFFFFIFIHFSPLYPQSSSLLGCSFPEWGCAGVKVTMGLYWSSHLGAGGSHCAAATAMLAPVHKQSSSFFGRCLYRRLLETPLPFSSLNAVCTQICKYIAVNKVKKQTRIPSQ